MANVFDGGDVGGKASKGDISKIGYGASSSDASEALLNDAQEMPLSKSGSDNADQVSKLEQKNDSDGQSEAMTEAAEGGDNKIENNLEAKEAQKDPAEAAQERIKNAEGHMNTLEGTEMEDAGKKVLKEMGEIMGNDIGKIAGKAAGEGIAAAVSGGHFKDIAKAVGAGAAADKK